MIAPPTVIVLLKAPRPGRVKTRLAATLGDALALAVYRQLAERQVRALPRDWPAVICFAPPGAAAEMTAWLAPLAPPATVFRAQATGDLGARLAAAGAAAFAGGATAVLLIGGDCPALDEPLLRTAAETLLQPGTDAVLGPAVDGGYVLLGLRAPAPGIFSGIDWSTARVLDQTRARLAAAGLRRRELPVLADLDDETDWRRAVADGILPQVNNR